MDVPRLLRPLSRVPRWAVFRFALTGLLLQAFGLYWDIWRVRGAGIEPALEARSGPEMPAGGPWEASVLPLD